jgi:uncharacterized lipoprotein YajG
MLIKPKKGEQKMKGIFTAILLSFPLLIFSGCMGNITVDLSSHMPAQSDSKLAAISPQIINLEKIQDVRTPGVAEGTREAAFGVPMGNIEFTPTASEIVNNVIKSELQNAGHKLSSNSQYVLSGKIKVFKVGTNTTPLYWDIVGKLNVELNVSNSKIKNSIILNSSCTDRTYLYPSGRLVKKVMNKCLNDFANQFKENEQIISTLK